ncbi:ABC transporter substrate-binding protein [Paenibacillus chitinolyticus]|uniref:ABC transporter substrate-binding protein n=1 Tax=Paenibacillus chitinolyticus TaxID=79263 RepID=UPI001C46445F|nr:ABC transporter substrate-binding protein [Paenibacillus chitinolyticus]MBV6715282.1 SgrR family transcriptional regulator [Paenibacillus chitinolyticus]
MNITEHFLRFYPLLAEAEMSEDGSFPVTIGRLADLLCCSSRNVKFILRKLEDEQYIRWQPGRGRGNSSRLTLLKEPEDAVFPLFRELMHKGKLKEAIDLLSMEALPVSLKHRLRTMLDSHLGFQVEESGGVLLDVLRVTHNKRLETHDPAYIFTTFESYLISQVCSRLISYDPAEGRFVPGLAHAWQSSDDCTRWTFFLRKEVRFHHGRRLTVQDVLFTVRRLKRLPHSAWLCEDIGEIETVGEYALTFKLSRSSLFFPHILSSVQFSILPGDLDPASHRLTGTGPFRIAEQSERLLVLSAFDAYYGHRPLLDRVELLLLPEDTSNERRYQISGNENNSVTALGAESGQTELKVNVINPVAGSRYLLFNFRKPGIHHNADFRKAMRMILDRAAMVAELKGNRIAPADSFLQSESEGASFEAAPIQEAVRLLRKSGYRGEPLKLFFMNKKEEEEEARWLRDRCAQAGLPLTLQQMKSYERSRVAAEADLLAAEEVLEDDLEWGLISYYKNRSNYLHHLLTEEQLGLLDRILDGFAGFPEPSRMKLLREAERTLKDNDWLLFGCHVIKKVHLHDSLQGRQMDSFGLIDISRVWIQSPSAQKAVWPL